MLAGGCPTDGRGVADDAPLRNASARRPNSSSGFFAGGVALAVEFAELGVSAGGAANESAASKSSAAFAGFGGAGAAPGAGDTAERGCGPRFGGPDAGSGLTWACCGWATGWGCIGLGAAGSGAADATGAGRSAGLGRSPVAGSSEMIFRIEAKISSMDGSVAVCARDIAYPLANPNTPIDAPVPCLRSDPFASTAPTRDLRFQRHTAGGRTALCNTTIRAAYRGLRATIFPVSTASSAANSIREQSARLCSASFSHSQAISAQQHPIRQTHTKALCSYTAE